MGDTFRLQQFDFLDDASLDLAQGWAGVAAAVQQHIFGDRGSAWTFDELRALHRKTDKERVDVVARVGDDVVGALGVLMPLHDNETLAMFSLNVLPGHRGRGIGTALLAEAERIASEHGRTSFLAETEWTEGGTDESGDWAMRRGYSNAQTVLRSEMAFPADRAGLAAILSEAGAEGYLIETYVDEMPEDWLPDRALLQRRMSTDAPLDDIVMDEEEWDADRLREELATVRAAGRRIVESVARHASSGCLVGFTQVQVPTGDPTSAYQEDTLVLKEHRGHGLGLRLKAATALRLMDELPQVTSVRTWNAASNAHMLAVNRRLGYVVDGYSREWQKNLPSV